MWTVSFAEAAVVSGLLLVGQSAQPPTIRTGVNVVEVDVVVVDERGTPVSGLQQQDFEVREDGQPVEIATFTAVDVPEAPAGASVPPADLSGTATATNSQPADGRVILIILDDYHVSFDAGRAAAARTTARRLLERLGPYDMASVITTSGTRAAQAEFTSDKARLLAAVDKFFPQSEVRAMGVAEGRGGPGSNARFGFIQDIKARQAMDTMSNAARALALIPGRRKAVLLVSQGLPLSLEEIITNPAAGGAFQGLRDFILTAQWSNIAVYPVDPCGLPVGVDEPGCSTDTRNHLHAIAEGTGGFAVVNTNALESGVDRMVAENGTYYLLGYYSPAPPYDGKRHRIHVRVRRPGVQVRARESYVSPRQPPALPPAAPANALVAAPIQTRGLPIHLVAVPVPLARRPGAAIALAIEIPAAEAIRAGEVGFTAIAIDGDGRVRARQQFTSGFTGTPAGNAAARLGARLDVPPGRYQVRIAAVAPGARGSVFSEVDVPTFDEPVSLGGLSLAPSAAVATASAERLGGVLPAIPFAHRTLAGSSGVVALMPVQTTRRASGDLTIQTTLIGPDGTAAEIDSVTSAPAEYASDARKVYRVALDEHLPPGGYRLIVRATAGRHQASRELAFTIAQERAP